MATYAGNLFGSGVAGRVGADKHAGDSTALFLKKFAGEVMTVFDEKNIMKPLHTIRTISKGKSAQFPIIGTATAGYYSPGQDILDSDLLPGTGTNDGGGLNKFKQTETLIHIDKMLMSSTFIASIDELVSHFDVRAPYAHQLGEALANQFDKNVLKVALKTGAKNHATTVEAAAVAGNATDKLILLPADEWIPGMTQKGSVVYSNAVAGEVDNVMKANSASASDAINKLRYTPDATALRNALFESARLLDEKDVPSSDRYAIITPEQYYTLINSDNIITGSVINRDIGGQGSIATGTVSQIAGITLLTSMHLPGDDQTGAAFLKNRWDSGTGNDYSMDYTHVAGIVFQKGGFGTLKLQDMTMESEYLINRQGNLFVSKYSMGHGPLRPESVVVWSDGTRPEALTDADVTS